MPRRGNIARRDVLPDPLYNSKLVTRLINNIMLDEAETRGLSVSQEEIDAMLQSQHDNYENYKEIRAIIDDYCKEQDLTTEQYFAVLEEQVPRSILRQKLRDALGVIAQVMSVLTMYTMLISVIGFFTTRKYPEAKRFHRYAVLVAARNEEAVIARMVESVRNQAYPSGRLTVFVVADNCTDATALAARRAGAVVYEHQNENERTKGFALRYLVTIKPSEGKKSLYEFWDGDKKAFLQHDETALKAYIEFCAKKLDMFFSAIKNTYSDQWGAPDSKLLSVTAMNGFIIAYNRQLAKNGVQDFAFYRECFEKMDMDFSKDNFPYTSSQYRKFSNEVLQRAFGFTEEELGEY